MEGTSIHYNKQNHVFYKKKSLQKENHSWIHKEDVISWKAYCKSTHANVFLNIDLYRENLWLSGCALYRPQTPNQNILAKMET